MNGILLRLAGPLSSWGHTGAFTHRTTNDFPTRSALIGMFASALGRPREQALAPHNDLTGTPTWEDLTITVRVDRPGTLHVDYHTSGGGRHHGEGLLTAKGDARPVKGSTHISHRHYLAGAAFTLAVQGPDPLLHRLAEALIQPHWAPYLGRRACMPDEPLLLAGPTPDPIDHLRDRVPLTLPKPPKRGQDTVPVHFLWEHPETPDAAAHHELADNPADFTPTHRRHHLRPVWRTTEPLRATLYAGHPTIDRLTDYVHAQGAAS